MKGIIRYWEVNKKMFKQTIKILMQNICCNKKNDVDLFSKERFEFNDNNMLLEEYYQKPNYKVVDFDLKRKYCYVFFSSNALFYPDNKGTFLKKIKIEDKYEWENLVNFSNVPENAAKCIYIRDIRKTWYITGINKDINTIDKLIELVQSLTKGYEVITVGSSAGGYIASLVGAKIKAYMVFNFSGQFSLYCHSNTMSICYWINKYKENNQYYDICEYIREKVPIVYFYPKNCMQDMQQAMLVESFSNVLSIPIESDVHGVTISNREKAHILTNSWEEIKKKYCEWGNISCKK